MSEIRKPRVPIEPGFFTIPDDPATPPRLLGSRCRACGEHFFPRRAVCARCLRDGTDDVLLSPRGTLYTCTYVHFPLFGSKRAEHAGGYGVGQVDLPEGPRVQAVLPASRATSGSACRWRSSSRRCARTRKGSDVVIHPLPARSERRDEAGERRGARRRDDALRHLPRHARTSISRARPGSPRSRDAGISFSDVGEAFVGYIFAHADDAACAR